MFRGSATTDGHSVYVTPSVSTSVYQYELGIETWDELPSCPYSESGLITIDGELTAVGGQDGICFVDKLFTLRKSEWVEEYPPMITARSRSAVVSTPAGDHIIAIGGIGKSYDWTAAVELLQVKTRTWSKLTDLPRHLSTLSATVTGNEMSVIGDNVDGYSCSLQFLSSSGKPIESPSLISWAPLPPLPVTWSTVASLFGQLVIVGGGHDGALVNTIYQLVDGKWKEIGSMVNGRAKCLVASPSPDKMMIVGGWMAEYSVEECVAML